MEQRQIVGVLPAKVDDSMTEACRDDGAYAVKAIGQHCKT
jgi:hypothetical protein